MINKGYYYRLMFKSKHYNKFINKTFSLFKIIQTHNKLRRKVKGIFLSFDKRIFLCLSEGFLFVGLRYTN